MKKDNIKNANFYYNISKNIELGLKYIENTDFSNLECGRYEIQGSDVYALVQDYESKPIEEGKFEAHRKYIDIQYVIKGEEQMGVADVADFNEVSSYSEEKDIIFLSPKCDCKSEFIKVKSGEFAIFEPQDAHMPSISIYTPEYIKKVVVKVLA